MSEPVSPEVRHVDPGKALTQAVVSRGVAYLAGQVAEDGSTTIEDQTRAVLENLDRRLADLGSNREQLLSVQVWLKSIDDFDAMNAVWIEWLDGATPPARATGEVALADSAWLVEMIATAAVPD